MARPFRSGTRRTLEDPYIRYGSLGIQFAATLAVFGLVGGWLDRKLGTFPLLLIVGIFAGFAGGLVSLVKKVPPARGATQGRAPTEPEEHRPEPPR